jgi:polysaccharide pyruvyl transferase WcaK-like protein
MMHEKESGKTVKCYSDLVKKILDTTDFNIALVSHVICKTSNDTDAAKKLVSLVGESDRIKIFDRGNAEELKGVISKCRFFVAARTHASIAAYSQRIPTLVVGYSVKSKGIAKDIFGTYEGYVIPVQSLDAAVVETPSEEYEPSAAQSAEESAEEESTPLDEILGMADDA